MNVFNAVLPVVTLIIGVAGTLITEQLRDRRAHSAARHERREAFELEHLTLAAATLDSLMTDATMIYGARTDARSDVVRAEPSDGGDPERATRFVLTWQEADRNVALLLDEETRTEVRRAINLIAAVRSYTGPKDGGDAGWENARRAVAHAQELVGGCIRRLYDPSISRVSRLFGSQRGVGCVAGSEMGRRRLSLRCEPTSSKHLRRVRA